jgi:ABC-2 type transport system permease protein
MFLSSLKKELLLVVRDLHALLVLFAMPVVFVLIMSLALQEDFSNRGAVTLNGWLLIESSDEEAQQFQDNLRNNPQLQLSAATADWQIELVDGEPLFVLRIHEDFATTVDDGSTDAQLTLYFAPNAGSRERLLVQAAIKEAYVRVSLAGLLGSIGLLDGDTTVDDFIRDDILRIEHPSQSENPEGLAPTSVQQNVPAWLIFAMYFIVIPIATTFVQEKRQKTLSRLKMMGVSVWSLYGAKLLPYMLLNLMQLGLMLVVGVHLVPLLGGQALSLDVSFTGLIIMTLAVSVSALGFAALVATMVRTPEQATIVGGTSNIMLGAIGGIMVPTFIMPPVMQSVALVSPMSWGLEGFLDILLRGGTWRSVLLEAGVLTAFGLTMLLIAVWCFINKRE